MNFDIVKVASCSSRDWPLLEKVAESGKPLILSTGGLTYNDIDDVVSFFEHRGRFRNNALYIYLSYTQSEIVI